MLIYYLSDTTPQTWCKPSEGQRIGVTVLVFNLGQTFPTSDYQDVWVWLLLNNGERVSVPGFPVDASASSSNN